MIIMPNPNYKHG